MAFSSSFLKHAGCWMRVLHQIQQIPLLQEETDRLTHPCGEADPLSQQDSIMLLHSLICPNPHWN